MIDLHCHLLPGVDDGPSTLDISLQMARMAVADGITTLACTPHIYPGMYDNTAQSIRQATSDLQAHLDELDIPLQLTYASDTHVMPNLIAQLQRGEVPTFNQGRYFLLEPPHHVQPPNFAGFVFSLLAAGYIPIITHPERLSWIENDYAAFVALARHGAWMQLTAGSLTGRFGANPQYWAERMLDEGLVHVIATDSHAAERRPPLLREGVTAAAVWVGAEEAERMVTVRPQAVLDNLAPEFVPPILALDREKTAPANGFFAKIKVKWGL